MSFKRKGGRAAALALALCLLLCSACGGAEVDITKAPEPTAAPMPTPGPSPTPEPTPTPEPGEMVRVVDIIPDIRLDIRYTAAENFTGEVIYESAEAYLRRGTAEKLSKVQDGWRNWAIRSPYGTPGGLSRRSLPSGAPAPTRAMWRTPLTVFPDTVGEIQLT